MFTLVQNFQTLYLDGRSERCHYTKKRFDVGRYIFNFRVKETITDI